MFPMKFERVSSHLRAHHVTPVLTDNRYHHQSGLNPLSHS